MPLEGGFGDYSGLHEVNLLPDSTVEEIKSKWGAEWIPVLKEFAKCLARKLFFINC